MAQYGKTSYWDERYTKDPEPFDWYQRYSGIQELIAKYIRRTVDLMSGCGNPRFPRTCMRTAFSRANTISRDVIDQMIEKYKEKPALTPSR